MSYEIRFNEWTEHVQTPKIESKSLSSIIHDFLQEKINKKLMISSTRVEDGYLRSISFELYEKHITRQHDIITFTGEELCDLCDDARKWFAVKNKEIDND